MVIFFLLRWWFITSMWLQKINIWAKNISLFQFGYWLGRSHCNLKSFVFFFLQIFWLNPSKAQPENKTKLFSFNTFVLHIFYICCPLSVRYLNKWYTGMCVHLFANVHLSTNFLLLFTISKHTRDEYYVYILNKRLLCAFYIFSPLFCFYFIFFG